MNTNINLSNIEQHFSQQPRREEKNDKRYEIKAHNFLSINEVNICRILLKIPNYENYFSILDSYKPLDRIDKRDMEINENTHYFLFEYSDKNSIDFIDFIYSFQSIKKLIFYAINTMTHLLNGLNILNTYHICFFDISTTNILFLEDYNETPVLSNFQKCFHISKLDVSYLSNIVNTLEDFTYQPFEIHILHYILRENSEQIMSATQIEEFCENFTNEMPFLRFFSNNYKQAYKLECIEVLKRYMCLSNKDEIITNILKSHNKWTIYGISLMFFQIFVCIVKIFSLKNTIINKIVVELAKNLQPNSDKRYTLKETLHLIEQLLNGENNWTFVNRLENSKMKELFDEFSK
jgi:hypothetical protein